MKKSSFWWKSFLIILMVFSLVFVASCGSDDPDTPDPDDPGITDPDDPGTTDPDTPGEEPVYFTVTLDADGGSISVTSVQVKEGESYAIAGNVITYGTESVRLENPTKEGYDFDGWYNAGEKIVDGTYQVTSNVTLVAHWTSKEFTITLDLDGGKGETSLKVKYKEAFTLPTPTKDGYEFAGWFNGTNKVESGTYNETTNLTLKAKWEALSYKITLDVNGGDALTDAVLNVKNGEDFTLPTPTKAGFEFGGWFDGEKEVKSGKFTYTADLALKAKWNEAVYTITLDVNGGDPISNTSISIKKGETLTLPTPTKTGYEFLGWYGSDGSVVVSGVWNKANEKLAASWKANKYTITLDVNGGNALTETTLSVEYDKSFTLPTPKRDGYTFNGWLDAANVKVESGTYNKTSDLALKASWTETKYTLTLDPNGGEVDVTKLELALGESFTLPTPKKDGATFAGWYDGDTEVTSGTWNKSASVTVKARWSAASYTVTFDVNGGSKLKANSMTVVYGQSFSFEFPTLAGYRFVGWYEGEQKIDALIWEYDHNMEVKAMWEEILPEKIKIDGEKALLELEQSSVLVANVYPTDANVGNIVWASSDETVAKFEDGKLVAKGSGSTTISATAGAVSDKFVLTVLPITTSLAIADNSLELHIGDQDELTINVTPEGANTKVTWSFDQEGIVTVNSSNTLTALKGGLVHVTATSVTNPNFSSTYELRVYDNVEGMTIDMKPMLKLNSETELKVKLKTVRDDNSVIVSNSPIKWASSNSNIVEIDEVNGKAIAHSVGTCTLTATAQDTGKFEAKLIVTVYDTEIYIDTTEYYSVADAIKAAKDNDVITLGAFTCNEEITVTKSNITFSGLGVKLTNPITLVDGISNVTFTGITFTDNARIATSNPATKVGVSEIYINDCIFDNVKGGTAGGASEAAIQFLVPVSEFFFYDNEGTFVSWRAIRFETTATDIFIDNNTFHGGGNLTDTILGMSTVKGKVYITNNWFDTASQSFIMIRYIGTGAYDVVGNTFIKGASTCVDLREAENDLVEATINVSSNNFMGGANSWGAIRLRNSLSTSAPMTHPENIQVSITANKFTDITLGASGYYVDKPTSACTEGLFTIDNNYSDQGEPKASWFSGMQKTMTGWAACYTLTLDPNGGEVSVSKFALAIGDSFTLPTPQRANSEFLGWYNGDDKVVSGVWNTAANVTLKAKWHITKTLLELINEEDDYVVVGSYTGITKQGYDTIAAALAAVPAGGYVVLTPGLYTDLNISVTKAVTFISLNSEKGFDALDRYEEARLHNCKFVLSKELAGVGFNGLYFTGSSTIMNTAGTAGTSANPATNLGAFTFANNIVESAATGNGFIYFTEASSSYSHNVKFTNNRFKGTNSLTAKAMVWIDNTYNLEVIGNTFAEMKVTYAFYVNDKTKGASGETVVFKENVFTGINNGNAIHLNWVSFLPASSTSAVIEINDNTFNDVTGAAVVIGPSNNGDYYKHMQVNGNTFTGNIGLPVLIDRVVKADVYTVTGNTFNCTLGSVTITLNSKTATYTQIYVANGNHASTNKVINATGNTYAVAPTDANFTTNVTH